MLIQNTAISHQNKIRENTADHYTERISFDKNSNITSLVRYGKQSSSTYGKIDDLTYTYNGNQLTAISDNAPTPTISNPFHFKDSTGVSTEYLYDANGNMKKDVNKGISQILYNHLNLPSRITYSNGRVINYVYSASGAKLKVSHKPSGIGITTTTDYVNGYIFTNNSLSMALTDNGYYTLSSTGDPTYHFYLKDHQGNNRVVVSQSGSVEQVNHYYPYGALFAESTNGDVQRFKYNGKELDRKFGLNWYDHGARHNDAAIGRWHCMDPMAEEHPQFSPYSFCMGDPVNFGDYDGMDTLYFRINKDKVTANYTSRTLCEGDNVGIIKDDGGNTLHQFSFAHQDDAKHFFVNQEDYLDYCENNNINPNGFHMLDKVCLMSNEDVSSFISPIPSMDGGPQAWIYAWKESRGENKTMDIMFQINKRFQGEENLYIPYEDGSHIFNADGLVAHDKFNFGNYLWGIAIHKLGISYPIGVLGAHIDNMIHHWGALDSNDDQYSIRLGYFLGHR